MMRQNLETRLREKIEGTAKTVNRLSQPALSAIKDKATSTNAAPAATISNQRKYEKVRRLPKGLTIVQNTPSYFHASFKAVHTHWMTILVVCTIPVFVVSMFIFYALNATLGGIVIFALLWLAFFASVANRHVTVIIDEKGLKFGDKWYDLTYVGGIIIDGEVVIKQNQTGKPRGSFKTFGIEYGGWSESTYYMKRKSQNPLSIAIVLNEELQRRQFGGQHITELGIRKQKF